MAIRLPEYTSGQLEILELITDKLGDFSVHKLKRTGKLLCYRELSIFDRTRQEFEQVGKEITLKLRIPLCKEIRSGEFCLIENQVHLIYNATHTFDKNGFKETELTLIRPDKEIDISG